MGDKKEECWAPVPQVDYRALLEKYVAHVAYQEGAIFLSDRQRTPHLFTDAEWAALQDLVKDIDHD